MKTPLIVFYKDINEKGICKIDRRLNLANEDRRTLVPLKKELEDAIRYLEIGQEEKLWGQNAREDERQKTIDNVLKILDEVSSESSRGGVYWNSAQTIKVLRRRIMTSKGGDLK